jgi:hypothetical protein
VVDEHTEPSRWARAELLDDADEIVDATNSTDRTLRALCGSRASTSGP